MPSIAFDMINSWYCRISPTENPFPCSSRSCFAKVDFPDSPAPSKSTLATFVPLAPVFATGSVLTGRSGFESVLESVRWGGFQDEIFDYFPMGV